MFVLLQGKCHAHSLSHPTYPLDLLTRHPQVHLPAFRQPNRPHFNLCLALYSRLRGSQKEAFCVRALDVMHGKWWIEPVWWPHTPPQGEEEGTHLEMAAVKMCLLGVCYVSPQPPVADRLLIKQKLDTETNYCIVSLCGFIQGFILSVGLRTVGDELKRRGQRRKEVNVWSVQTEYLFNN